MYFRNLPLCKVESTTSHHITSIRRRGIRTWQIYLFKAPCYLISYLSIYLSTYLPIYISTYLSARHLRRSPGRSFSHTPEVSTVENPPPSAHDSWNSKYRLKRKEWNRKGTPSDLRPPSSLPSLRPYQSMIIYPTACKAAWQTTWNMLRNASSEIRGRYPDYPTSHILLMMG